MKGGKCESERIKRNIYFFNWFLRVFYQIKVHITRLQGTLGMISFLNIRFKDKQLNCNPISNFKGGRLLAWLLAHPKFDT